MNKQIILIDDNASLCAILCDFFTMHKINCVYFQNEADARMFLKKNGSNNNYLILLDRKLGSILSDLFAREIKTISPQSNIVLITASKKNEINSLLTSNIIDAYIEKPFAFEQLISTINQYS